MPFYPHRKFQKIVNDIELRHSFNPYYEPCVSAKKKWDALLAEAYTALKYYDEAQQEYKTALRMAPNARSAHFAARRPNASENRDCPSIVSSLTSRLPPA